MIFLENFDFSPLPLKIIISDLSPISLFLGKGPLALEVAVFRSNQKPSNTLVHKAFNKRRAGRATPILVVIIFPEGVILCGTIGEKPRIFILQDFERAERVCANA